MCNIWFLLVRVRVVSGKAQLQVCEELCRTMSVAIAHRLQQLQ